MDAKQIKEAIAILYDMEIHNYKMTRTIQRLNYEISCLGNYQKFYAPQKYEAEMNKDWAAGLGVLGVFLGAFVGLASGCESTTSFFGSIEAGIGGLIGGGIAGFLIGAFVGLCIGVVGKANRDSEYEEEYQNELEIYNNKLEKDEARVKNELARRRILEAERKSLIERKQKAEEILDNFYMRAGIDRMFRSLVPISKMNEIVNLGITTTFGGENGLYDRVRKELREDAFYAKLDEISRKLDDLISKTDRLYGEILNLNSQCENLIDATMESAQIAANNNKLLSEAVKNTSIAAYNSERIAAEQRYQSFMMTYHF